MIDSYHLYLTSSKALLRKESGLPWKRKIELVGESGWNASQPSSLALHGATGGKRLRPTLCLYVGSALCKFMVLDLPPTLRNDRERRVAALAQMQHQLGLEAGAWEVSLDALEVGGKFLACAIPRALAERLRTLSKESGLRLVSVRPYFAAVWNAQVASLVANEAQTQALLAIESDAFTSLVAKDGKVVAISAMPHHSETGLVEREIKRLTFSMGAQAVASLRVVFAKEVQELSQAYADKRVCTGSDVSGLPYADFRELLSHDHTGQGAA